MSLTTIKVEVAFDAGVTGTPTWTDVTKYVRIDPGIGADHWRGDEDSLCQPSSLDLVLRNDDGRFTPGNASSPYYPNVKRRRRIRVTSTLNGETFYRFFGYINDWQVDWPGKVGWVSDCRVSASSRMAVLGAGSELRSILEEEVLADSPAAYYTLTEPEGTDVVRDIAGGAAVPIPSSISSVETGPDGTTSAAGGYSLPALGSSVTAPYGTSVSTTSLTLSCWVKTTHSASSVDFAFLGTLGFLLSLGMSSDGSALATVSASAVGMASTSTTVINDGQWHHLAATVTRVSGTTTVTLYVDEAAGTPDSDGTLAAFDLERAAWGSPIAAVHCAHLAIFGSALPADRIQAQAGSAAGFVGETPAERLARYARFADVPESETDFDAGQVPDLAHIDTTGVNALAAMRKVEETEGGVLFDGLDGTLRFHDRAHRYAAAAFGTMLFGGAPFGGGPHGTDFTLSYSAGHINNPLRPVLDDQQQVNDATATNASGVVARRFDQASIDDDGLYRSSPDLATTDPDEPLLRTSWMVTKYAQPLTRVSSVEVKLNTLSDELAAAVLSAEVGTIFTLADLPGNAPSEVMHLFVEGRRDLITGDEDVITFRTSPVEVSEVFLLDDPDRGLDSGYPLAY